MDIAGDQATRGVLNQATRTVHKREAGPGKYQTVCGHTRHVDPDHLLRTAVETATDDRNATKCGRCFDDGGGY
ncbi:MAG: hypothetical protein ABEH77_00175 [Halobacteriaceae archaeon]